MRTFRLYATVAGFAFTMAGILGADSSPSPTRRAADVHSADLSRPPVAAKDVSPAKGDLWARDAESARNAAPASAIDHRVTELESEVVALHAKCTTLERQLEKVELLLARILALEEDHAKVHEQFDRFQLVRRTRDLNPTELKETSDIINQRINATSRPVNRTIYVQAAPTWQSRTEEPLYGP